MALTAKQRRFVDEYLIDLNATQAAIRAGYRFPSEAGGGYYTYLLIDPRDCHAFYAGKGRGTRIKQHVKLVRAGKVDNAEKCRRIREIHEAGLIVSEFVFSRHEAESEAFGVEADLISALRDFGLTNIAGGVSTNENALQEYAQALLGKLKTYEEWMATIRPSQIESAVKLNGSTRAVYDHIRSFFESVAAGAVWV